MSKSRIVVVLIAVLAVAAWSQAQERPLRTVVNANTPVVNATLAPATMKDLGDLAKKVDALSAEVAALKEANAKLKEELNKQSLGANLRLTNLEIVSKEYQTHTHQNTKMGLQNDHVMVWGPKAVQHLKFPLSGPIQPPE